MAKTPIEQQSFLTVMKNLNREVQKIGKASQEGIIKSIALIRWKTENVQPMCPVGKTGTLHNSWTVQLMHYKTKNVGIFGYTAEYALWVHEMVGAHFQKDGAGAKWLIKHIKSSHQEILTIIANTARV